MGPQGTGVPSGSKGPPGSQEPLGKRVTEVNGAQRGSVAPRVTSADLVPRGSLEWPGLEGSRACQAGRAGTACQDSMARRVTLVATVPQERRVPTGCRVSQDEQGPRARRENWAEPESWVRPAPRESPVSPETSACLASVARLATGAQRGLWAHKAPPGSLVSEASRARRAAWGTRACQAPRASEVAWVTGALEEPQALRETRVLRVPMAFLGTKANWVPVALSDPKESLAAEGSWARKASRVPTAPAAWRACLGPLGPWASRACKACLASPGNPASRGKKPVSSASGSCAGGWSVSKSRS